ncbi:MAG TPA: DJ-1 family glyoxalase III [Candidatus Krumholzibacteria bacterium]|nr:DJ-1 family glyoxalase III [Candidatus Krumholzibacteria bacterium]
MAKRVIVPIANGFEEIEAVVIVDILRRAGLDVVVAGVEGADAIGSHDIALRCDVMLDECDRADAIVLPGGMPGSKRLRESDAVRSWVTRLNAEGKLVAAICAAPTVLESCGVLEGRRATSHPSHADEMKRCVYQTADVVTDGNVVTSRGAGTAIAFAAEVVRHLVDDATANEILARIQYTTQ